MVGFSMNIKLFVTAILLAAAVVCGAGEWRGLTDENWYSGKKLTVKDLRRKVVLVEEWGVNCADCIEVMPFVEKCWRGYCEHPFIMIASHRQGKNPEAVKSAVAEAKLTCPVYQDVEFSEAPAAKSFPFFYVLDSKQKVVYAGNDKNEAITAVADAISAIPRPGDLISSVYLKKFRSFRNKLVIGKSAEGAAIAPLKQAAKRGKPADREEAQAILDSIDAAKKLLEEEITYELSEEGDKGLALRNIRWYIKTWPSEKAKYEDDFAKLSKDPEAVKGEKDYFARLKKKKK